MLWFFETQNRKMEVLFPFGLFTFKKGKEKMKEQNNQ